MTEAEFIAALRGLPLHPGAHGLADDAAHLGDLIFTKDMIVEGVHYLPGDPPGDVAWKLLAANLSDLAAKGAVPVGALLGYALGHDDFDRAFLAGLGEACAALDCPLLGGDTVRTSGPRTLSLTAIGRSAAAPLRGGARAGDALWVTGSIGDAGAGLAIARGREGPAALLAAYRRPQPLLAEGRALAAHVSAMMDVSDGLLIDAARMADASGCAVSIDLAAVPLSAALTAFAGDTRASRLAACTAGDDYQLLFALAGDRAPPVAATRIGGFAGGRGLSIHGAGAPLPLPASLGWLHD
ncbi:thiamine-phosphate kinase [Sphingomonas baiyangensis]|uniref:Thiamine-monophosphate kinase n=1 Tax=Sphingomonas baiyangensis TaxID=2572576 RepID=A0A4U1L938_9SPHN|nr:thiamine-phosphate kinase [Sphingomonas baiyangensis]TKD52880.1 thiamine-phosphate kinase [Sphingomonas baiyangensis]